MDTPEVMEILHRHMPTVKDRFKVRELSLFGSMARGEAHNDSDIDVLVNFDGPATAERYFGLQFYLEDLLGRPVDLVTIKALREELKPYVEQEALNV